jgi:hypothetical protein
VPSGDDATYNGSAAKRSFNRNSERDFGLHNAI